MEASVGVTLGGNDIYIYIFFLKKTCKDHRYLIMLCHSRSVKALFMSQNYLRSGEIMLSKLSVSQHCWPWVRESECPPLVHVSRISLS